MKRLKQAGVRTLLMIVLGGLISDLKTAPARVSCAECGEGPKDKKCPDGYKCVDLKCVKK